MCTLLSIRDFVVKGGIKVEIRQTFKVVWLREFVNFLLNILTKYVLKYKIKRVIKLFRHVRETSCLEAFFVVLTF